MGMTVLVFVDTTPLSFTRYVHTLPVVNGSNGPSAREGHGPASTDGVSALLPQPPSAISASASVDAPANRTRHR
jgi:hypothetical protein